MRPQPQLQPCGAAALWAASACAVSAVLGVITCLALGAAGVVVPGRSARGAQVASRNAS